MNLNISPTRTSGAQGVGRPKSFRFSTARTPAPRAGGRGIAIASSVVARPALITVPQAAINATRAFGRGDSRTPVRRPMLTSVEASKGNTVCRWSKLRRCASLKAGNAQYVSASHRGCLLTIAIPKGTSGPCFARRATRFLAGMKRRQTPSFNFNATSRRTRKSSEHPCHADVLLELANKSAVSPNASIEPPLRHGESHDK